MSLILNQHFTDEPDRQFIEAFWDVLSAIYRRERAAVQKQYNDGKPITADELRRAAAHQRAHGDFDDSAAGRYLKRRADWNDKIARKLAQSKTRQLVGDTITELLQYARNEYRSRVVESDPQIISHLIHHPYEWRRALNLARLALVSWSPKSQRTKSGVDADPAG
jgi:hypothetical protein